MPLHGLYKATKWQFTSVHFASYVLYTPHDLKRLF